jgi:hypothetical protein
MLLVGTLSLVEYAEAVKLDKRPNFAQLPDYWNKNGDRRYQPEYTWDAANNDRYGNPDSWINES